MQLNRVMLIGYVGMDPNVRILDGGKVTATFALATSEKFRDKEGALKEITEWHNIVCWDAKATIAEKYVRKGMQLYIEGKIRTRSWDDKQGQKRYTTEIIVRDLQFLDKKDTFFNNITDGADDMPAFK